MGEWVSGYKMVRQKIPMFHFFANKKMNQGGSSVSRFFSIFLKLHGKNKLHFYLLFLAKKRVISGGTEGGPPELKHDSFVFFFFFCTSPYDILPAQSLYTTGVPTLFYCKKNNKMGLGLLYMKPRYC